MYLCIFRTVSVFLCISFRTLRICETCLTFNNLEEVGGKVNKDCAGYTVFNTLLAVIKVLLNLTHDNSKLTPSVYICLGWDRECSTPVTANTRNKGLMSIDFCIHIHFYHCSTVELVVWYTVNSPNKS